MPDPNDGAGGRYLIDPKTGARMLVERTCDASPVPLPEVPDASQSRAPDDLQDPQGSRTQQPAGDEAQPK